jgi:hypothetical protein
MYTYIHSIMYSHPSPVPSSSGTFPAVDLPPPLSPPSLPSLPYKVNRPTMPSNNPWARPADTMGRIHVRVKFKHSP